MLSLAAKSCAVHSTFALAHRQVQFMTQSRMTRARIGTCYHEPYALPVLTVWFRQLCLRRNSSKATLNSMFIRGYSSYYSTAASTNSFVLHPCVETTQGPMLLISLVFVHFFQQQILTYNFSQSTLKLGLLACSVVHFDIKPRSAISLIFHHESCSLSR